MSLERKDVRFKLDHDVHAALAVIADADGMDIGELVERWVKAECARRVHAATLIHNGCARLGITGNSRERSTNGGLA